MAFFINIRLIFNLIAVNLALIFNFCMKSKHVCVNLRLFNKKGLRLLRNSIEYAAHQRNERSVMLSLGVELAGDEPTRRSLRDYEEQLVWIFTD